MLNTEGEKVVGCCQQKLCLAAAETRDPIGYQSAPLCVIDAVFSINAKYESDKNLVDRYCNHFGLQKERTTKNIVPPTTAQLSMVQFLEQLAVFGSDRFPSCIFNPTQVKGRLKWEIVAEFAATLAASGVRYLQHVSMVATKPDCEKEIVGIYGVGVPTWKYFLMLCRMHDLVKADRWLRRFVGDCVGRKVNAKETERVLQEAHKKLIIRYPKLTLRLLDHEIWLYGKYGDAYAKR